MKPGYEQIRNDREINLLIEQGNRNLKVLGYTEHSRKHAVKVAETAGRILKELGYRRRQVEMAKIAGYMHDIGNAINRNHHAEYGALLANDLLKDTNMSLEDRVTVIAAIGNHDEATGTAVSDISAALILADKSDVHRDRVRNTNMSTFDKHDKVNYAVTNANFSLDKENRKITLDLTIDTKICPVLDYFEIFMDRTMMSKFAAKYLDIWFELIINDTKLL